MLDSPYNPYFILRNMHHTVKNTYRVSGEAVEVMRRRVLSSAACHVAMNVGILQSAQQKGKRAAACGSYRARTHKRGCTT